MGTSGIRGYDEHRKDRCDYSEALVERVKEKEKESEVSKVALEMKALKGQLDEMRNLKYDITSLKGSISSLQTPARRQFISPRQMVDNRKTPAKQKSTPRVEEAGRSRTMKRPLRGKDPRKSARRTSARRRILQGKQISEDMLSALQMEDLKKLCVMHGVWYKSMSQARVALRKISGLIVSDTEDLPDKKETRGEARGGRAGDDVESSESESEDEEGDGSSSEEVEVEYSEGQATSKDVQPNGH
ncbi:hypothetical protein CBR_g41364 [Chara braunii]|uniref:Uncharacterized protein n=1 Tax=Chara braunii TaxID=69332 RepID=A0A388LVV2_CHABU|nr:hypothetical protein CBR_g41364 [Chara braunii]|eukprot:GBG86369.1 hypothetical protein CBR_g41364 [Chara braunii]